MKRYNFSSKARIVRCCTVYRVTSPVCPVVRCSYRNDMDFSALLFFNKTVLARCSLELMCLT